VRVGSTAAILVSALALTLALSWLALAGRPALVSIRVLPAVLMAGQSLTITCRVELHTRHRAVRLGLVGYAESQRPLDGLHGPLTTERLFSHVPCDVDTAYCSVVRDDGSLEMVRATVLVACE